MVEDKRVSEFAIVFKRTISPDGTAEEFTPIKIVEGYYYDEEECFIDTDQNVYPHIASLVNYGNVYGGRTNVLDIIEKNQNVTVKTMKRRLLEEVQKYRYFRNDAVDDGDFGYILTQNKETKENGLYIDKDTEYYYDMYHGPDAGEDEEWEDNDAKTYGENESTETALELSPSEIIERIKRTVKGQDEAIEEIVTLLWMRYKFPELGKTNMMVLGSTGVGKTEIFRKVKEIFQVPVAIFGVTGHSQVGYKGGDIDDALIQLYYTAEMDLNKAENGIIVLDEFDKLSNNHETGEVGTTALQNELLKLVEGCERKIELDMFNTINMNTSNIVFVGCGAFADLINDEKHALPRIGISISEEKETKKTKKEDIVIDSDTIAAKGGISGELVGRLPVVIKLRDLSKENLKDILLNSDASRFTKIIKTLESQGISIENPDAIVDAIVNSAYDKKIGARGLLGSVMPIFLKIFKAIGDNPEKYESIIFGENIVKDNSDFVLVPRRVKTKTKSMN